MVYYVKKLQYPVNIKNKNLKMAKNLLAQLGGPDGEIGAAMRYFCQKFTMPCERGRSLLNDISIEELGHVEMIATMVYQLMEGASIEELENAGLIGYYTQHNRGIYPVDASGVPYTASYIESTGNYIADLASDMAAEEKARVTYENLMNETNDPDLLGPLSFLRQREVVHYNRFKELLEFYQNGQY